ncbi:MAG TPA: hypothetical protein VE173_00865 [Longimicrobiales bacterium]|nr:hypothetical protein [Longimicrobiales bacterium]
MARKVILLTLGVFIGLIGLALAAGGGAVTWAYATQREDGYITSSTRRFETEAFALASGDVDLRLWPGPGSWIPEIGDVAVRIRVDEPSGRSVFIGIAPAADVSGYLDGVAHTVITDPGHGPFGGPYLSDEGVWYREEPGGSPATPPDEQPFWAASVSGPGAQTLNWTVREGEWTIVVMHPDASRGLAVDGTVGVKAGFLLPLGIGLLVLGLLVVMGGTLMVVAGARSKPRHGPEEAEESASDKPMSGAGAGR